MKPTDSAPQPLADKPFSRRRLFELGGATVGLAAFLAACGKSEEPAAGRVGNAPVATDPPPVVVDDIVYLRTMTSLEHSLIDVYAVLAGLGGLAEQTTTALTRFTADHTANAAALAQLTTDAGGDPYSCSNSWLMERAFQPALDNIVGKAADGNTPAIPPTDDANRDTLAMINGLETLASATYQHMVAKLSTASRRAAIIPFGAQAARHSAAVAIIAGGDEDRFVSPVLLGAEAEVEEFPIAYAIASRFGQLTAIEVVIGTTNDLQLRYNAAFETPADNAYIYTGEVCA